MTALKRYLTEEGRNTLEEELHMLKTSGRQQVADSIHKAHETGGNIDNAEYDETKEEQSFIEGRIKDIEQILATSITAPSHDPSAGMVDFGSTVTVRAANRSKKTYVLVGSAEAKPLEGKISNESPVGQALLGRKAGDKVEVITPSGITQMTITRVR